METIPSVRCSTPEFLDDSQKLIDILKKKSVSDIQMMMNLSDQLAQLNHHRYQTWNPNIEENTRPSMYCFKGDVYQGLKAEKFDKSQIQFAQKHLRILSGLYGVLKPLDAINPYRLEMGTALVNPRGVNLYDFWRDKLTAHVQKELTQQDNHSLINLASQEYSKALDLKKINAQIITPIFKDEKNGVYKIISFYAKKARGLMAAYIINNQIVNPDKLSEFTDGDYHFIDAIKKSHNETELLFHHPEK